MPSFNRPPLARRLLAELLGTALLVTVVVGSGIAAQQLSPGNVGMQPLENSTATVLGLTVLAVVVLALHPDVGSHADDVVIPDHTDASDASDASDATDSTARRSR